MRSNETVVTQVKEAAVSTGLVMKKIKIKYSKTNRNIKNLEKDLIMNGQVCI